MIALWVIASVLFCLVLAVIAVAQEIRTLRYQIELHCEYCKKPATHGELRIKKDE